MSTIEQKGLINIADQSDYLVIDCKGPVAKDAKTLLYYIWTKDRKSLLGEIRWYAPWRKYCFTPNMPTVWESDCLTFITKFLVDINREHKIRKAIDKSKQQRKIENQKK